MMTDKSMRLHRATLEHRGQPLLPRRDFIARMLRYAAGSMLIVSFALGIGILGYHHFESLSWLDSFLNAAMILGGMGPVNEVHSAAGKLFAGCYALFSGLIFLVATGVLLTPALHRLLHHFHVEAQTEGGGKQV
jgi:hypothetical protein